MADPLIEVKGLRKFRSDLRAMGTEYRKELDRELKKSVKPIADDAKARYRRAHPKRRGGRGSQRGIRAVAGAGKVRVILGSTRYPYLLGQEFGSFRYRQFPARKKGGYYFWPAIRSGTNDLFKAIEKVVDKASNQHFED